MIKDIVPAKLRQGLKSRVIFRTFPGAKIEDMKHYLQPTLKAKPTHLIVHVGTNDLEGKSPEETIQNILELGKAAIEQVPGLKLSLSEIITRSDREDNDQKVQQVNRLVQSTCYLHISRNMGHFAPALFGSGRSFIIVFRFQNINSKYKMASKASCSRKAKFKHGVSHFCKSKKEVINKVKKSRPPACIGVYEAERLIARRKNGQVKFT